MKNLKLVLDCMQKFEESTKQAVVSIYIGAYLYDVLESESDSKDNSFEISYMDEGLQFEITWPNRRALMFYRTFTLKENEVSMNGTIFPYSQLLKGKAGEVVPRKCSCELHKLLISGCKCGGV